MVDRVEWVNLDTEVLREARRRAGLSYEAMGRKLNVAAKTWERYEKSGRVPRSTLAGVAEVLGLEIEQPQPRPLRVMDGDRPGGPIPAEPVERRLERVEALVAELVEGQHLIAAALGVQLRAQAEQLEADEQLEAPRSRRPSKRDGQTR